MTDITVEQLESLLVAEVAAMAVELQGREVTVTPTTPLAGLGIESLDLAVLIHVGLAATGAAFDACPAMGVATVRDLVQALHPGTTPS